MTPQPRRSLSKMDPDQWVSIARVAAHYDCSYDAVWTDVKRGSLKSTRVGRKRVLRVKVKDALAWGEVG